MPKPKIRKAYDRVGYPIEGFKPSMTKQSFRDESDINRIMARYRVSGLMRQVVGDPMYLDCTQLPVDYQDALNKVVSAREAFEALSSDVRSKFNNDPALFVDFASDPANLDQMREWRLAPPAPPIAEQSSDAAPAASPTAASASDGK